MNLWKKIWFFALLFIWIFVWNFSNAEKRNLPWVAIISRAEWWADESIRFRSTPRSTKASTWTKTEAQKKAEDISIIRNAWMAKNFPLERKYEWSNTMFWNHYLIYPDYFNHHKNKIIIHHTAVNYNPSWTISDVKKQIQDIYKYHTINRDFGDIGYNFLIDQMGNIYEWRAGWEWAVWMHASSNNVSSIWISLMWNFENDTPTLEQMEALVNLTTAIAKYYNIDPFGYTYTFTTNTTKEPYVTATKNPNIMWHKNVKSTACPWTNLYKFLPKIRKEVLRRINNWIVWNVALPSDFSNELEKIEDKQCKTPSVAKAITKTTTNTNSTNTVNTTNTTKTSTISNFSKRLSDLKWKDSQVLQKAAQIARNNYKWKLTKASKQMSKITKKYSVKDIKYLMNQQISVLLYELTTKYDSFEIKCDSSCIFTIDGVDYNWTWANLTFLSNRIQVDADRSLSVNEVFVRSANKDWTVEVSNYNRKSYAWIPWNKFKGSLYFEKWVYPTLNWEQKSDFIVVNTLPFSEYMKGIVETNDTETLEKNKVMAMISKNYALFYMNKENIHPSISPSANYTAIDNPDFFQKYVWAGLEKTLTKRYQALNATKNQIVMYDNYLPILPYFNCSPGFTLSAEEKWGWNDTPYLKSVYDFDVCNDFAWHGVGLAWKWAERFAKQWMTYDQILKYYYDGIEIVNIN